MKMIIKLCLDTQKFSKKPTEEEISKIAARIGCHVKEISIKDFAKSIIIPNGKTYSPSVFKNGQRSIRNWISQQIFVVDIENDSLENVLDTCERVNLFPSFIYTPFNSDSGFKMVFVMDEVIHDIRVRNLVIRSLLEVFPQSKTETRDPSRIIYGGREVIYENFSYVESIPNLIFAACSVIRNSTNASRNMYNFCRDIGIDMENGYPKFFTFHDEKDMPEVNSSNVYVSMTKKCKFFINNIYNSTLFSHMGYAIYFCYNNTQDCFFENENDFAPRFDIKKENTETYLIKDYPFENLYKNCRLYREAIDGEYWLHHNEMFGLMSNLLKIKGGVTKVDKILNSREEYKVKNYSWWVMKNQILKGKYAPSRCESYCPFIEDCKHGINMIEQGKLFKGRIQVVGKRKTKSIEEARKELSNIVSEIIASPQKGIYVIKAPAGLGKTEEYINASIDNKLTIAVPTHKLKDEVSDRLAKAGVHHYAVPQLPDIEPEKRNKLDRLYDTGSFKGANMYLRQLAKENEVIATYIKDLRRVKKSENQTILTTHQRIFFEKDFNDTLIIDEDIVLNGMFPISSMSIQDMVILSQLVYLDPEFSPLKKLTDFMFELITKTPEGVVLKTPNYFMLCAKEIEKLVVKNDLITTNILGFLNSSHFVKVTGRNGNEQILFINKRDLPDKKVIIFSATANEKIYKMVFGQNMKFYDIGDVEHKGEIWQVPIRAFSKLSIHRNKKEMMDIANALINRYNPDSKVITYSGYFNDISEPSISFWNSAGRDNLKGQNITVIGTPHINPYCYLLFASALGLDVRLNESKVMYQPVSRGNYNFYFNTYSSNDLLREIQFYMIESELVQTVGRARTITEPCKVLVLSNYPVPGAEFISLTQREVKEYIGI
jgi:hypothetical protein